MTISKENRVPRGRPKIHNFETKQEYFRNYYKLNRDRWNVDYLCPTCELYCSFVNKARHARSKFHLKKLAEKDVADEKPDKTQVEDDKTQVDKPIVDNPPVDITN
jgi:hypothetical protein